MEEILGENILERFTNKDNISVMCNKRAQRQKLNVLFVEDDEATRTLLGMTATSLEKNCEVTLAETMKDGAARYLENVPNIAFLDIQLPDGSGLDILKLIKANDPDAYVVMITANTTPANVNIAITAGADAFIAKPFTKKKIQDIFDKYVNKQPRK